MKNFKSLFSAALFALFVFSANNIILAKDKLNPDNSNDRITSTFAESCDEVSYNDSFEWDPVQQKKERVIIVGSPSQLGNSIGKNRDVKVKRDGFTKATREKKTQLENDEINTLVKDADVIVVNGKNAGGKLKDNEYIKGGLRHGVPMVFENVNEAEMSDLIGLGMPQGEVTIVTNYTDRQGASIEVISTPKNVKVVEGKSSKMSKKPTTAEINKAKKEGKNIKKSEQEAKAKVNKKANFSAKTIKSVTVEDKAKKVMKVVGDKNRNIRSKAKPRINGTRKGGRGPNPDGFPTRRGGPNADNLLPFEYHYEAFSPAKTNSGFDFSLYTWDVTYNWTWDCNNQTMSQRLDLEVTLAATIAPSYRKYVRVRVKDNSYFKPGTLRWNSEYDKGYVNRMAGVRFDYLNTDGSNFKLDKYAPKNQIKETTYNYSTGFSLGASAGASADGPNSGLSASYSESTSTITSIADFEAYASSGPNWVEFKFEMGKSPSDYVEQCAFCTPSIINLPATATSQLNPQCDAVFTAPGDYNGSKSIQVKSLHSGINIWSDGDWFHPHWWWKSYSMNIWSNFSVDFSKVNYPHLAIDKSTSTSGVYSDWHTSRAVDGYTGAAPNTYSATSYSHQPYMGVDLGESDYIYDIDVWNAVGYGDYLKDYWVMVSDTPFTSGSLDVAKSQSIWKQKVTGKSPRVKKFNTRVRGRYVRVQRDGGSNFLVLGEIACNPRRN